MSSRNINGGKSYFNIHTTQCTFYSSVSKIFQMVECLKYIMVQGFKILCICYLLGFITFMFEICFMWQSYCDLAPLLVFSNLTPAQKAAVVHLNFRAGSTFPVPVCTVSPGHRVNKADTQ